MILWLLTVLVELLLLLAVIGHMIPLYLNSEDEEVIHRFWPEHEIPVGATSEALEAFYAAKAATLRKWARNFLLVTVPIFGDCFLSHS